MRRTPTRPILSALLGAMLLAGCGGDRDASGSDGERAPQPLPQPRQAGGSVTGMPTEPGPGGVPLAGNAPPEAPALLPADANFGLPPLESNPETGLPAPSDPASPGEPTVADATATLQAYATAINARAFADAQALWTDGGRGSGQTPEQFAADFADIAQIDLAAGTAGPVEGAAGSRYVTVPVTVSTTLRDGSVRHQAGSFTLRRAMVDGATPEQRAWRIASADLRDAVD